MFPMQQHRVAVLGAGRSGQAAAALCLRSGASVEIWDERAGDSGVVEALEELVAKGAVLRGGGEEPAATYDWVVTSPGIDLQTGWGRKMAACGRRVIGEMELGYRFYEGRIVGITGTNGKTTTTEMVAAILVAAGMRAEAAGNYGPPLSEVVMREEVPEALALEVSSFQLETTEYFRPDVAVWLNFAPDHLDRYPSLAEYRSAKERIFRSQRPQDAAVVPPGEVPTAAVRGVRLFSFAYGDESADFHSDGESVFNRDKVLFSLDGFKLRGRHNIENLLASTAVAAALEIDGSIVRRALEGYRTPPHRYEHVADIEGVAYINDSKSTNIHSLATALHAGDKPVVLIAGGKDKGLDYASLSVDVATRCRAVVAIGEMRPQLEALWGGVVEFHKAGSMEEAVDTARRLAEPGDVVLLSPGTSSYDMYKNFEERGQCFATSVRQYQTIKKP